MVKATKKTRKGLIETIQKSKKELTTVRFRLSVETQRQTAKHRTIRKTIARAATELTALAREQKIVDDTKAVTPARSKQT